MVERPDTGQRVVKVITFPSRGDKQTAQSDAQGFGVGVGGAWPRAAHAAHAALR